MVLGSYQQDIEVGVASALMGGFSRSKSDACDRVSYLPLKGFTCISRTVRLSLPEMVVAPRGLVQLIPN